MFLVTVVLVVLLIFALALFPIGLRGRRIDDHPICRKCGFDLFGAPPGSVACPECGADVTRPRAIRTGNRVSYRGLRAAALIVLLVSLTPVLKLGWALVRNTDLTPYKPAAAIIRDVGGNDATASFAMAELARRVRAGGLSDKQISDLVDRALARQANRNRRWSPHWGEFLEAARDTGRVDDARWAQYLREAVTFEMTLRPWVRRGDPIPFWVMPKDFRVGHPGRLALIHTGPSPLMVAGVALGSDPRSTILPQGHYSHEVAMYPLEPGLIRPTPAALAKVSDGAHLVTAHLNVTMIDAANVKAPFKHVAQASGSFWLQAADKPSVAVVRDDSLTEPLRRALKATVIVYDTQVTVWIRRVADVSQPLAAAVSVRAGDREWPIGSMVIYGPADDGELSSGVPVAAPAPGFAATSVDVILRSGPSGAIETTYLTTVWEGEVVLTDVEVTDVRAPQAYDEYGHPILRGAQGAASTQPSKPNAPAPALGTTQPTNNAAGRVFVE